VKAIVYEEYGSAEVLRYTDVEEPPSAMSHTFLTNRREHERPVRVAIKKGVYKMNATKIPTGMDTKGKLRGSDRGSLVADPIEGETTMNSPKRLARIAGVLYLLVGIFGGFAEGFVEPRMYVAGDAATTAGNVVANSGLVRLGVVADLFNATVWVFLGMTLYILLKHVHKNAARAMLVFVAIGASIVCLNTVFEFEGLRAASGAVNLAAFGAAGSNALVLLLLDTQHYGIFIAQIFFGLWLVPLGYLAYKSAGWFPRWLGVLLIVGGVCYLVDLLATFLVPDFGQMIHTYVTIPSAVAEISMVLYLLVIGVKTQKPGERIPTPTS
jgi:hypothetical protein